MRYSFRLSSRLDDLRRRRVLLNQVAESRLPERESQLGEEMEMDANGNG